MDDMEVSVGNNNQLEGKCNLYQKTREGKYFSCPAHYGNLIKVTGVKTSLCSIKGWGEEAATYWSLWSKWSTCTRSCGIGYRQRFRECTGGEVGDSGCDGTRNDVEQCLTATCTKDRNLAEGLTLYDFSGRGSKDRFETPDKYEI